MHYIYAVNKSVLLMMRQPLLDVLKNANSVLVMDGGQGTELENRGMDISGPVWSTIPFTREEFWNSQLSHRDREIVNSMFKAYIDAGAQLLSTVTYQASYKTVCSHTKDIHTRAKYDQLLDRIVGFCRCCVGDDHYLVGSIGPYAAHVGAEYTGDYGLEPDKIDYWLYFEPQLANFNRNEALDLLGFETVPNVHELRAILSWDETKIRKPFYVSLCIGDDGNLRDGTPICQLEPLFANCTNKNMILVGINCCSLAVSSGALSELRRILPRTWSDRLLIYPNSGEIYCHDTQTWSKSPKVDQPQLSWSSLVQKYKKSGARIIGGCCRTTPSDIQQIHNTIDNA